MKRKIVTYLPVLFLFIFIGFCSHAKSTKKDNSKISVVVIDPGHGGKDYGASIGSAHEKDIVLDIALKLGSIISQNYSDIKVVYTRSSDVFIPLHKRAEIANKSEADLFLSIHVNAVETKSVQGTETFVLGLHRNDDNLEVAKKENAVILLEDDYSTTYEGFDPNLPESYIMFETMQEEYQGQSVLLASNIQDEFRTYAKRMDRSVKMAGFLVLRRTTMPSVLIETGFLSHTKERSYLLSSAGKNALATSIYRAFTAYKNQIEERSKFNLVTADVAPQPIKREPKKQPSQQLSETTQTTATNVKEVPKQIKTPAVQPKSDIYFTVQIMALKKQLNPTPENFNGEKNIYRVDAPEISRYFSGKFDSFEKANNEKNRIRKFYKNAFVVAFQNNELISVKKALHNK